MPFVRVSRDKRGYETIYLVHASQRRGRSGPARVLYVFRTPPGIKVGRDPFDADLRRRLEAQNPGVEFDWEVLSNIPAPPPDVEHWRERRRVEKAARLARKAEEAEDVSGDDDGEGSPEAESAEAGSEPSGAAILVALAEDAAPPDAQPVAAGPTSPTDAPAARTGRRRRRGGRRRPEPRGGEPGVSEPVVPTIPPAAEGDGGGEGEDVA